MSQETRESAAMPAQICQVLVAMAQEKRAAQDPIEACGLIVVDKTQLSWTVLEIENRTRNFQQFKMDTEDLMQAYDAYGENVVGCWHTHYQETFAPSKQDKQYAPPGMRYWIVTTNGVWEYDMRPTNPTILHNWMVKREG